MFVMSSQKVLLCLTLLLLSAEQILKTLTSQESPTLNHASLHRFIELFFDILKIT